MGLDRRKQKVSMVLASHSRKKPVGLSGGREAPVTREFPASHAKLRAGGGVGWKAIRPFLSPRSFYFLRSPIHLNLNTNPTNLCSDDLEEWLAIHSRHKISEVLSLLFFWKVFSRYVSVKRADFHGHILGRILDALCFCRIFPVAELLNHNSSQTQSANSSIGLANCCPSFSSPADRQAKALMFDGDA